MPSLSVSLRSLLVIAAAILLVVAAVFFWHFHLYRLEPIGEGFFRSRQPRGRELVRVVEEHGIRTVINLRGWNPKRDWYREEEEAAKRAGAALVNLPLETFDWPPRIETQRFVRAVERSERPVLIHCATGVDRSAWAAGVVRLMRGESLEAALDELSPGRGHVCSIESCPLHQFFEMYRRWLKSKSFTHSSERFRRWATEVYCPVPYDAKIQFVEAPPTSATPGETIAIRTLVTNASPVAWTTPVQSDRGIRLGARSLGPFEQLPAEPVDPFRLPRAPARDLFRENGFVGVWPPGLTRQVEVRFTAPERAGQYLVQIDMVDELVHWFSDLGREGLVIPLMVAE